MRLSSRSLRGWTPAAYYVSGRRTGGLPALPIPPHTSPNYLARQQPRKQAPYQDSPATRHVAPLIARPGETSSDALDKGDGAIVPQNDDSPENSTVLWGGR